MRKFLRKEIGDCCLIADLSDRRQMRSSTCIHRYRSPGSRIYCVSGNLIALDYIPGVSGNHPKGEECTKATPPPNAVGADR